MDLIAAVTAAAPDAPQSALDGLTAAQGHLDRFGGLDTPRRAAHLIGQCAHESLGFTRTVESLYYTTPARLTAVWPQRFTDARAALPVLRNPRALANAVYGGRMGNTGPDDGWTFRGRGWLQLTGRANYRALGRRIGVDLESRPEDAADPAIAWAVAGAYLATRRRAGRTALDWADSDTVEMVTRIVNGGLHGLDDRRYRTALALSALEPGDPAELLRLGAEGAAVTVLQHGLAAAGFPPGALDGQFGPRTEAALRAFQGAAALVADGIAGRAVQRSLLGRIFGRIAAA